MWGGFDLGNISQLGNQLGEALQRAKHEIDAKLDQTFTFDEQAPRRSSDSTNQDAEQFTVDASGQLISTGRPAIKQPATVQKGYASSQQQQIQEEAATPSAAPDRTSQNGHAKQALQLPTSQQSNYSESEAAVVNTDAQYHSSRPIQKKIVKKTVHRNKAEGQDATSAAGPQQQQHEQEQLPVVHQTSTGDSSRSAATAGEQAAAASSGRRQEAADAADRSTVKAASTDEASAVQQPQRSPKQKKGLGVVRLGQQPQQDAAQQQPPEPQVSSAEVWQESEVPKRQQQGILHLPQHQQEPQQQAEQQQVVQRSSQHLAADLEQQVPNHQEQHLQDHLEACAEQLSVSDNDTNGSSHVVAAILPDHGTPRPARPPIPIPRVPHQHHVQQQQHDDAHQQQQADDAHQQQQQEPVLQESAAGQVQEADLAQDLTANQQPTQQLQQQEQLQQQQQLQEPQQLQHCLQQQPNEHHTAAAAAVATAGLSWAVDAAQQQPVHQTDMQQLQQHPANQHHQHQHHDQQLSILQQQVSELQQQLTQREGQLARQAQRLGDLEAANTALSDSKAQLEQVVAALTGKNEQLAMRASKVNEQELEEVQREAAERLAAAERKVFALIKERDALKRAAATGTADGSIDARKLESELKKKDELVEQLMVEGQKLSKRQLELESAVKKLRQQVKASDADKEKLNALVAAERAECESLRKAKTKAERDLAAAIESGRQEVEALKQQGEEQLLKAQADKATAEATAAEAAAEDISGQLAASEARAATLAESVRELQEALESLRASADLREEMLRQDLSDLERRAHAAELRHQELSAKMPEATAPLLRQIISLQDASTAQAQAWAAAERSLMARVHEAEGLAAAAAEGERVAQETVQLLQARLASTESAATAAKASASDAAAKAARASERLALTEQQLEDAQAAAQAIQTEVAHLREELKQQEHAYKRKVSNETAAKRAAEEELLRTRQELSQLQGMMGSGLGSGYGAVGGLQGPQSPGALSGAPSQQTSDMWRASAGPPALAAPGFRWILVREGCDAAAVLADAADGGDPASSVPGTPHSAASAGGANKLLGRGSTASSVLGAGFFDTQELLQSDAASVAGVPAAVGVGSTGGALTPTSSNTLQLHQAQLRAAQQRLGGGSVGEAQVQRFKAALKQKVGECFALEARVKELEETRDQLAGELLKATQDVHKASDAVLELPKLQQTLKELEAKYAAAVELVGERDEQLEEMANDLEDVKQLYRQQIETLLASMAQT